MVTNNGYLSFTIYVSPYLLILEGVHLIFDDTKWKSKDEDLECPTVLESQTA